MEDTLNQLMSEKKKNEDNAKKEFDKRVKDAKEKAIEENKKNAEKSGNKLTQTINSKGELVSVKNLSGDDDDDGNNDNDDCENHDNSTTLDDIRKQMFDTENVVIDKKTDHGLSRLTENQNGDNQDGNIGDSFYSTS
jgi:hypothetical protein